MVYLLNFHKVITGTNNKILLLALIVSFALITCTPNQLTMVDVGQKVNFSGTLQYQMFYGVPGFGEDTTSDEKEPAYILHTEHPFLFRDTLLANDVGISTHSCTYDTVSTIQIRVDRQSNPFAKNLKNMVGKKITLTCTLYGAHTGHHHAPVLTEKVFSIM